MIVSYWLTSPHLFVDTQLLWQMRNFCIAAGSATSSTTMNDKAKDLMRLIDDRVRHLHILLSPVNEHVLVIQANQEGQTPGLLLSPGRRIPRTAEMLPRDLAIAMTLLEGDKYKNILPTDYIAHLNKQARPNNVEAAYLVNNKIVLWVKQSVLHYDTIDSRAQVLKFFVNTALVC